MKSIYKYEIDDAPTVEVPCSAGCQILKFGEDHNGGICMWHEVETDESIAKIISYDFQIFGTGHYVQSLGVIYRDTVIMKSGLVWHIYENRS